MLLFSNKNIFKNKSGLENKLFYNIPSVSKSKIVKKKNMHTKKINFLSKKYHKNYKIMVFNQFIN